MYSIQCMMARVISGAAAGQPLIPGSVMYVHMYRWLLHVECMHRGFAYSRVQQIRLSRVQP